MKYTMTGLFSLLQLVVVAQFHTMKIPQSSPRVQETHRLGITEITIDYGSPSVRGRDVWSTVVRSNSDPNLVWRAGANINTRISFSTDVEINGQPVSAGSYGFHIDMDGKEEGKHTLIFAHHDNQWGSYYLDRSKHVSLEIEVAPETCPFSEQLDYELMNRTDDAVTVALEWGEKRIPFTVSVDLNKTVVDNFRYELLGINTYHWQAWNDAAVWCLNHDTNLEEALTWAQRSINGGYGGFAANENFTNLMTKARLERTLNKPEAASTLGKAESLVDSPYRANEYVYQLLLMDQPDKGLSVINEQIKKYPDSWFLKVKKSQCLYFTNKKDQAVKLMTAVIDLAPENYHPRIKELVEQMKDNSYELR